MNDPDPASTNEKDNQINLDQLVMVCNLVVNVRIVIVDEVDEEDIPSA